MSTTPSDRPSAILFLPDSRIAMALNHMYPSFCSLDGIKIFSSQCIKVSINNKSRVLTLSRHSLYTPPTQRTKCIPVQSILLLSLYTPSFENTSHSTRIYSNSAIVWIHHEVLYRLFMGGIGGFREFECCSTGFISGSSWI